MRFAFVSATVLCGLLMLTSAHAQQRQPRPSAITDVAEAGPDFELQGEYAGWARTARGNQLFGLQVVAMGDGKFDAMSYLGGLPGNGWDRQTTKKLSGQIDNGKLVLTGPEDRMLIADKAAIAIDGNDRELWRLTKMNRTSSTMGLLPPPNATVLFDGSSVDHFQPGAKVTDDGLLIAGVTTKMPVQGFRMHLEFRTPYMPTATGQARGNSGVYIQRRYEVQILDSFGLEGAFNEAGSLYRQTPPDLNMAFPPLTWQTYDIWFYPPRFEPGSNTKTANARITVLHNGIPVHYNREITAKTGGGQQEGPTALPIQLQDHGNPVMFRNIWLIPLQTEQYYEVSTTSGNCCRRGLFHRRRCG